MFEVVVEGLARLQLHDVEVVEWHQRMVNVDDGAVCVVMGEGCAWAFLSGRAQWCSAP